MTTPDIAKTGLCYHPYIGLVALFSMKESIRRGGLIHARGVCEFANLFTTAAWRSRELMRDHHKDAYGRDCDLDNYLFNPVSFVTFGPVDGLGIVLLDDFDPFLRLSGDETLPIERASLAFFPTLESLGLSDLNDSPFTEFHRLNETWQAPQGSSREDALRCSYRAVEHSFYRDRPLVVATRFKTSPLGVLQQGIRFQRAIFRAMARKIESTLGLLRENLKNEKVAKLGIRLADLRQTKVVFADDQSSEDVLLVTTCSNYSVAVSLVAALRGLSFEDIIRDDSVAAESLSESMLRPDRYGRPGPHHMLFKLATEDPNFQGLKDYEKNHCFSNSYSVTGVAPEFFLEPDDPKYAGQKDPDTPFGLVEVYGRLDISPGHFKNAKRRVDKVIPNPQHRVPGAEEPREIPGELQTRRILVGRHDYDFSLVSHGGDAPIKVVTVATLCQRLRQMFEQFDDEAGSKRENGTSLLGSSSWLVVPIPEFEEIEPAAPDRERLALTPLLPRLKSGLFRLEVDKQKADCDAGNAIDVLRTAMRIAGLPWALRRTIEYLFNDFQHGISDLLLFDSFLDLYDIFEGLFILLSKDLVAAHAANSREHLQSDQIRALSFLVDSVHNAVLHRVQLEPNTEVHDWAINLRGGLNRLIAATDVPLKCGFGLLKWCKRSDFGRRSSSEDSGPEDRYYRAVTRLTIYAETVCQRIQLSSNQTVSVTRVDMNVARVFSVLEFATYIHEAAHVLLDELISMERLPELAEARKRSLHEEAERLRQDEIFVEMLTHLFVFPREWQLFRRFYVARYNSHPLSVAEDDQEVLQRFTEVLVRAFFASAPFEDVQSRGLSLVACEEHPWCTDDGGARVDPADRAEEMADRFLDFVDETAPYFQDYERLLRCGETAVKQYCRDTFLAIFDNCLESSIALWKPALQIYRQYVQERFPEGSECGYQELQDSVKAAFSSGQADIDEIRRLVIRPRKSEPSRDLDELTLVCALICEYTRLCLGGMKPDRGIHLLRNENGIIDYTRGLGTRAAWNSFQLEKGYVGTFSCDPPSRRTRLKAELVVLKSLWHMSTILRGRRLRDIVEYTIQRERPSEESNAPGPGERT